MYLAVYVFRVLKVSHVERSFREQNQVHAGCLFDRMSDDVPDVRDELLIFDSHKGEATADYADLLNVHLSRLPSLVLGENLDKVSGDQPDGVC